MSQPWKFTQLDGGSKVIELNDSAAPHGRPRKQPVISTGKELREFEARYPGNNVPTRHIFGTRQDDIELTGRWNDKFLGDKGALDLVHQWEDLIEDGKRVYIEWGDFLSYTGIVKRIVPKWESQTEVVWTITFKIDQNNNDQNKVVTTPFPSPREAMDDVSTWLNEKLPNLPKSLPKLDALTGELTDALGDLVGNVTQFGGIAVEIAGTISDFESATFDELQRLRAGVSQFKTAFLTLQQTIDNIQIDALLLDRQAADDIEWLTFKAGFDRLGSLAIAAAANTERLADRAQRGQVLTSFMARNGDTWESIATAVFGGPANADRIRQSNGIKYGTPPKAGTVYNIPKS